LRHVFKLEDFLGVECDVVGVDDLNFGEATRLLEQLLMVGVAEMNRNVKFCRLAIENELFTHFSYFIVQGTITINWSVFAEKNFICKLKVFRNYTFAFM